MTSSWFFLSTLNYDARSTTHQICLISYTLCRNYSHKLRARKAKEAIPGTIYKIFLLRHIPGSGGPTQLSPYWISHAKRPMPEPDSSYTYNPPHAFMVWCLLTHRRRFSRLLVSGWCSCPVRGFGFSPLLSPPLSDVWVGKPDGKAAFQDMV